MLVAFAKTWRLLESKTIINSPVNPFFPEELYIYIYIISKVSFSLEGGHFKQNTYGLW